MRVFYLTALCLLSFLGWQSSANAQSNQSLNTQKFEKEKPRINPRTGLRMLPERPPMEPVFPEVVYLKADEPGTLKGKVEELIHGITVDIPPEYDQYGYEIRRYMASIGGMKVYRDAEALRREIANTKRAQIVLDYWSKNRRERMRAIKDAVENSGDPSLKTLYRFNSAQTQAFITEAQSWVENNRKMLEMLNTALSEKRYKIVRDRIQFNTQRDLSRFAKLYEARELSLKQMHNYAPFRLMIY